MAKTLQTYDLKQKCLLEFDNQIKIEKMQTTYMAANKLLQMWKNYSYKMIVNGCGNA